jgi:hypothetical protein
VESALRTIGYILLALLINLAVYAMVLRAAVWISNKCLGRFVDKRSGDKDDEYEEDDKRPQQRRASAIPKPNMGKVVSISLLMILARWVVECAIEAVRWTGMVWLGNRPSANAIFAMQLFTDLASGISLVTEFLIWCCALTRMLPTSFRRAALVALFFHLILLAIGVLIVGLEVGMGWMR